MKSMRFGDIIYSNGCHKFSIKVSMDCNNNWSRNFEIKVISYPITKIEFLLKVA